MKKNTAGAAIAGTIRGIYVSLKPKSVHILKKPSAETCVGIVMISNMKLKINFLPLKSYT